VKRNREKNISVGEDSLIWAEMLPDKFGGSSSFWKEFSDTYELTNKGQWAKDNRPHLGIARVLTFLKMHEANSET